MSRKSLRSSKTENQKYEKGGFESLWKEQIAKEQLKAGKEF